MRVNVYAEEMTPLVQMISKGVDGITYFGLRFYLQLPVTTKDGQVSGPFIHREGDDDSSAVTFWGTYEQIDQLVKNARRAVATT